MTSPGFGSSAIGFPFNPRCDDTDVVVEGRATVPSTFAVGHLDHVGDRLAGATVAHDERGRVCTPGRRVRNASTHRAPVGHESFGVLFHDLDYNLDHR